jgi:Ca-activated chloride channel family protein
MNLFIKLFPAAAALLGFLSACALGQNEQNVRLRVDFDRPVLPAGSTERVVMKVSLDCLRLPMPSERPPVNLTLVLDRSGSMAGDKLDKAREAAIEVIRRLSPEDIFSLVIFDNEVRTLIPARHVRNRGELEELVCSIRAGGGTALYAGVSQGASELRRNLDSRRYVHRMILLSDGQANVGPSTPAELGWFGRSLVKEGISVTTIGLGLGYNEDLMTRLAQSSDGNTYFAESSSDLERIFNGELGDVLSVIARRVVLVLDFPEGVRPIAFVGREGRVDGRRAELTLNQLYGGQEKYALIEVEVTPGDEGCERPTATANLSYEDVRSQRHASCSASGVLRYTRSETEVRKAVNQAVQVAYATNVIAEAKDKAVEYVDANRKEEGARLVRARVDALMAMPAAAANSELCKKAGEAMRDAKQLESSGLDSAARKAYRAENQQVKAQQNSR